MPETVATSSEEQPVDECVKQPDERPAEYDDMPPAQPRSTDAYAELEDIDFLDDIDFSLDDVESRIAPLALAYR